MLYHIGTGNSGEIPWFRIPEIYMPHMVDIPPISGEYSSGFHELAVTEDGGKYEDRSEYGSYIE